jgi:hypothetical protein
VKIKRYKETTNQKDKMSILTSQVEIKRRYWESPASKERLYAPYEWKGCTSTADKAYRDIPVVHTDEETLVPIKPSQEYLEKFAQDDGYEATHYYLCEFQMSDFALNGKVNIDMGCDETGKHFFIDLQQMFLKYTRIENPLENEQNTFYIDRFQDKTFHLNTSFELLAELEERGYTGPVWAVVADRCD